VCVCVCVWLCVCVCVCLHSAACFSFRAFLPVCQNVKGGGWQALDEQNTLIRGGVPIYGWQALDEHCSRCHIRLPHPHSITSHFDLALSLDNEDSEMAHRPPPPLLNQGWGLSLVPPTLASLGEAAGVRIGQGVRSVELGGHVVRVVGGPARFEQVIRPHVNYFSGLPRVDRTG
jgi:hypothetical protein